MRRWPRGAAAPIGMKWHSHPDAATVVRDHWRNREVYLVAQREPCVTIRDDEVANIDRLLSGGMPEDLDAWARPASWFIAVVLCPGDDTQAITAYVREHGLDASRVHFYLHPDTRLSVLSAWAEAGLPLDRVDTAGRSGRPIGDWQSLHPLLGLHLNNRILADFG